MSAEYCLSKAQQSSVRISDKTVDFFARTVTGMPLETKTGRAYKISLAVIAAFFGNDWLEQHITGPKSSGFLSKDVSDEVRRETKMMRASILAEMLWNLQNIEGFDACISRMREGSIEPTYAELEMGRMLYCAEHKFRFVEPSGTKGNDYDIEVTYSDGLHVCGEAKCKQEETEITLGTIKNALKAAQQQLPENRPGIVFVKFPRHWLDIDDNPVQLQKLSEATFRNSKRVVSIKYYVSNVLVTPIKNGDRRIGAEISEVIAFKEHDNPSHKFPHENSRNWSLFPDIPGKTPFWNGMPKHWKRIFNIGWIPNDEQV